MHKLQSFLFSDETHGIMFNIILFYSKVPSKSYLTLDNTLHLKKKPTMLHMYNLIFWLIFVYSVSTSFLNIFLTYSLKLKLKNCMTGYLEEGRKILTKMNDVYMYCM